MPPAERQRVTQLGGWVQCMQPNDHGHAVHRCLRPPGSTPRVTRITVYHGVAVPPAISRRVAPPMHPLGVWAGSTDRVLAAAGSHPRSHLLHHPIMPAHRVVVPEACRVALQTTTAQPAPVAATYQRQDHPVPHGPVLHHHGLGHARLERCA